MLALSFTGATIMFIPMPILIGLILFALPTLAIIIAIVDDLLRGYGLTFIGSRERNWDSGKADRTWCLFFIPLWRHRWTYGGLLLD